MTKQSGIIINLKNYKSGEKLADLHLNYEKVKKYPLLIEEIKNLSQKNTNNKLFFRVEKMKYLVNQKKIDKTQIIYNKITRKFENK